MEIKVITDISTEPVLLAAAKNHMKATYGTDTTEDALINSMITAARELIEKRANRTLAEKTIELLFRNDEITGRKVRLPYGPHGDITFVKRVDQEGTETSLTLNSGYYKRGNQFLELEFRSLLANPFQESAGLTYDYKIRLAAGYGITDTTEDLPEGYKIAILKQVAEWYVNREDWVPELSSEVARIVDKLSSNTWL